MKFKTADLHRLYQNALLFTPGKGAAKGSTFNGDTLFRWNGEELRVYATEGFVVLTDAVPSVESQYAVNEYLYTVPGDWLRDEERHLREEKSEFIEDLPYDSDPSETNINPVWLSVVDILQGASQPAAVEPFAIGPDRLTKLSRLKPQGEYPIDVLPGIAPSGQRLLYWKYGPTVRGVLVPLDREIIKETYSKTPEVLW